MKRKLTSRASTPSTPSPDCKFFYSILLCTAILSLMVLPPSAHAQHLTGRIKGTVKVTTEATDALPASLVGARLTLVNRDKSFEILIVFLKGEETGGGPLTHTYRETKCEPH